MRTCTVDRSASFAPKYSVVGSSSLWGLVIVILACFCFVSGAASQTSPDQEQPQAPGAAPGQTFAPIGQSGYRVPIPEIKMKNIIGDRPPPEAPTPPTEEPRLPAPPVPAPSVEQPTAKPLPKEVPVPQVPRLPFEPVEPAPKVEASPEPPPKKETKEKDHRSPLLKAPITPEDITAALPAPKKEVLPKAAAPGLPTLMDVQPAKESLKTLPLDRTEIDDMADPRLWIRLDPRREAESIAVEPEPEPAPELAPRIPKEETQTQPLPVEPAPRESIHQPMRPPEEPKESVPVEAEPAPPVKEEPTPVKESIASPFGFQAEADPEAGPYLKATAPILEELSLVMARTPGLTIADYDPSEANAPVFPKELIMKLDSLKRELQILDSKTFEIIPPSKYVPFHSLIRQSITQTYQACDEIINFFNDRNEQSLQKVRDHLLKARELIQQTREKT